MRILNTMLNLPAAISVLAFLPEGGIFLLKIQALLLKWVMVFRLYNWVLLSNFKFRGDGLGGSAYRVWLLFFVIDVHIIFSRYRLDLDCHRQSLENILLAMPAFFAPAHFPFYPTEDKPLVRVFPVFRFEK